METSSNLAAVRDVSSVASAQGGTNHAAPQPARYEIICTTRSSLLPALEAVRSGIRRLVHAVGGRAIQAPAYPGWQPDATSDVVRAAAQAVKSVTGVEPEIKAIHAGLECGVIGEKNPGTKSVSFGPTITGAHSPEERVQISTVQPFWEATLRLLHTLADAKA